MSKESKLVPMSLMHSIYCFLFKRRKGARLYPNGFVEVEETSNSFHSRLSPKTANPGLGCYASCWLELSMQSKAGDIELVCSVIQ